MALTTMCNINGNIILMIIECLMFGRLTTKGQYQEISFKKYLTTWISVITFIYGVKTTKSHDIRTNVLCRKHMTSTILAYCTCMIYHATLFYVKAADNIV